MLKGKLVQIFVSRKIIQVLVHVYGITGLTNLKRQISISYNYDVKVGR
jgi:hypothetical protein